MFGNTLEYYIRILEVISHLSTTFKVNNIFSLHGAVILVIREKENQQVSKKKKLKNVKNDREEVVE